MWLCYLQKKKLEIVVIGLNYQGKTAIDMFITDGIFHDCKMCFITSAIVRPKRLEDSESDKILMRFFEG